METNIQNHRLQIIDPTSPEQTWNEAEVLGGAVWLWMHSASHCRIPLQVLPILLLPAIKYRQFLFAAEAGKPVFYLSWANFSVEAEALYLKDALLMEQQWWNSGDRLWILDWVAPFGHTKTVWQLMRNRLFDGRCGRFLYHRGDERGLQVKTFHGKAVTPDEACEWFAQHPVALENMEIRKQIQLDRQSFHGEAE